MNRTNVAIWFIVLSVVATVGLAANPIIAILVGMGAIAFLVRLQNNAAASAWTQSRFARVALPVIAVGICLAFVYAAVLAVRIASNFGPVR